MGAVHAHMMQQASWAVFLHHFDWRNSSWDYILICYFYSLISYITMLQEATDKLTDRLYLMLWIAFTQTHIFHSLLGEWNWRFWNVWKRGQRLFCSSPVDHLQRAIETAVLCNKALGCFFLLKYFIRTLPTDRSGGKVCLHANRRGVFNVVRLNH